MTDYTRTFGGQTVSPTQLDYLALTIAADATLVWPFENGTGTNYAAHKIDLTASSAGLALAMPSALLVSPGQDVMINNVGAETVSITNYDGTEIGTVASGEMWWFYVRGNATAAGLWRTVQLGTGVSDATAAALAGAGIEATAGLLNLFAPVSSKNGNYTFGVADRAGAFNSTGGAITFNFDPTSTLTDGWFVYVRNDGSGTLTLTPYAGQTIDGEATKALSLGESCIVICDGTNLLTVGYGRELSSVVSAVAVNLAGSGTYTLDATEVAGQVQNYTGLLTGNRTVYFGNGAGYWFVYNNTTGAYSVTFKTDAGDTGYAVTQGSFSILRSDGTNLTVAFTATSGTVTSVATGTDLTGGPITSSGTIDHANSGVVAGSYGSATQALAVTVNGRGHISSIANATITAAWAGLTGVPASISSIAALTPAADKIAYFTGASTAALTDLSAAARTLLAISSYAVGDLVYASGAATLNKLPDVATGNALISGGVGVAPSYGKIGLTTHVSGILPVANGGTNAGAFTSGSVVFAGASGTYTQNNAQFYWSEADVALGIGTNSLTNYGLRLVRTLGGAETYAVGAEITTSSTNQYVFRSSLGMDLGVGSKNYWYHFQANQGNIGGAYYSLDTQYGFHAAATLTGATNNYGFYGDIAAGTARWNFYAAGTANNYMAGSLGIGTTTLTAISLALGKTITGATTAYGVSQTGVVQSGVTTTAYGYYNSAATQAAAFTLTSYVHYAAVQGTIGASSAVTNQYGFLVDSTLTGATNNYAFASGLASGTNRYNLYMSGTAVNYLAGNLGVGVLPTAQFSVAVAKNMTGALSAFGVISYGTVQSDVTTLGEYYRATLSTAAAAFTVATMVGYRATQGTYGATSAVTAAIGFYVDSSLTGAGTSNRAFQGDIASGSGRHNLYMAGTAANYFAGDLTIYGGTAIPAGGTAGSGYKFSSTSNFGIFFGSGAPTLSAAKGSLYTRSDGSSTTTRTYVNTDGGTTWTYLTAGA